MSAYPNPEQARDWVGQETIEEVHLLRLHIPLRRPYRLSFGTLTHFDTILCGVRAGSEMCWGETTPLPGYGRETADQAWQWSRRAAREMLGRRTDQAFRWAQEASRRYPFCSAALLGALEWPALAPLLDQGARIPLVAPLAGDDPAGLAEQAARLAQEGFATFKLKVGIHPSRETKLLGRLLPSLPPGTTLRTDANQALDLEGALALVDALDHPAAEYLEQPFPSQDWESFRRLLRRRPQARICLDESVWSEQDLDAALALGAGVAVKLKLMKQASAWRVLAMGRRLLCEERRLVFGNGVQGEIGSLAEAALYRALALDEASEGNGFARQVQTILEGASLDLRRGHLELERLNTMPCPAQDLGRLVRDSWIAT